jgi:hypothetical protein
MIKILPEFFAINNRLSGKNNKHQRIALYTYFLKIGKAFQTKFGKGSSLKTGAVKFGDKFVL